MTQQVDKAALAAMHTPEEIKRRIADKEQHSYLGDFVLGAVDGAVTTFAIVAGAAGAGLSSGVAIVLGLANIAADAFSMAASNYLKSRSDRQIVDRFRRMEEQHIDLVPEAERAEIRQIFSSKGFQGDMLEGIVNVITNDRRQWVDTMLTEEWGLQIDLPSPTKAALATFSSFMLAGVVPLVPLFFSLWLAGNQMFLVSAALTAATFFLIGVVRGRLADRNTIWTGLETLGIGGIAAALAYLVVVLLRGLAGA